MPRPLLTVLVVTLLGGGCAASGPSATTHTTPTAPARATSAATAPAKPLGWEAASLSERPGVAPPIVGDYRVAPRDQLSVQVHGQDDISRTLRVSENGMITLPLVGEIRVAGLSPREIETAVENALKPAYLKNPRVTVTVSEFRGRQFAVVGAVNQPGTYPIRTNEVTLLQALSEARGTRENADRVAYVLRAKPRSDEPQPLEVNLDALFRTGRGGGVLLEAGDSVYVPEANTFYVSGEVEKRGAYTLRRGTTLSKAIAEAGGVTKRAAYQVTIVRTTDDGKREEISGLDLDAAMRGDPSADVVLLANDVVVVPAHAGKVVGYGILDALKGLLNMSVPLMIP